MLNRLLRALGLSLALAVLIWPIASIAAGPLPGLWVTPLELDFGPVGVGVTSPPQVVTITNTGNDTLTNFAGGAPFDPQFGATQNCAGGVAPGASCQYTFTFTPNAVGVFSSSSNSSTNAGPFVIKLHGEGVGPKLSVSPLSLNFGHQFVFATSASQVVTIRNTGLAMLTDFAGGAPFRTEFGATQNCAGGVAPGASCQYTFTFTPSSTGTITSTSNSSTNAGPFVIKLQGTGTTPLRRPPNAPRLDVSPLELDFGPVGVGVTSPPQVVTITNSGPATLTDFAGGAPFDPQFGATQNCAGGVAPGASCQYTFTFKPSAVGIFSSSSNSSTNAGPFVIKLHGEGVGSKLSVSPLELDFGDVPLNTTSAPQVVTIRNTGLATLTDFAGGAPFDPQFGATQNCAVGVAPGASCQYTFTFKPTAAGLFSSSSNSSTNAGPFVIKLHGQSGSVPLGAGLSFTPNPVAPGHVTRLELALSNQNRATMVDDVALTISLPAGLQVAAAPEVATTGCGAGAVDAAAGARAIGLTGARVGVGAACLIHVNVAAGSFGSYPVSIGAIRSSNSGASGGTSAVLRVAFASYLDLIRR
jgi:hypothetical protein